MASKLKIGVIDYGMGNLHSVQKALVVASQRDVVVTDSASRLKSCDVAVLPGVGSFGAAMQNLRKKGLDDALRRWIGEGKPYLGICLGLQLLFDESEEDPGVKGLGVLPGRVIKFRSKDFRKGAFQIPHMGWNTVERTRKGGPFLTEGLSASDRFYFVHSYYPVPKDKDVIFTTTTYGKPFCSSVLAGRTVATQFHLEKSGDVGLQLLHNVLEFAGDAVSA
jgi:imidazole glycerol-phosphate synthase subunit HisH